MLNRVKLIVCTVIFTKTQKHKPQQHMTKQDDKHFSYLSEPCKFNQICEDYNKETVQDIVRNCFIIVIGFRLVSSSKPTTCLLKSIQTKKFFL